MPGRKPATSPPAISASASSAPKRPWPARLQHPNVVQILDAVKGDALFGDAPYLVMEYVPGVTLKHFCRVDRLLPLDQVVELGFRSARWRSRMSTAKA